MTCDMANVLTWISIYFGIVCCKLAGDGGSVKKDSFVIVAQWERAVSILEAMAMKPLGVSVPTERKT